MGGARGGPGRVVILGGGIMGCSTAYFLTKLGHQAPKRTLKTAVKQHVNISLR